MSRLAVSLPGLILPASGGGHAYAERTSDHASIGTAVTDISALTINPVPDSSQMLLFMNLPSLAKDATAITAATSGLLAWITDSSNVVAGRALASVIVSGFAAMQVWALVTGLTPGTAVTYKGRLQTGAGNVVVNGGSPSPRPFIVALRV